VCLRVGHIASATLHERPDETVIRSVIKTVLIIKPGAVAAPNSGFAFWDDALLEIAEGKS